MIKALIASLALSTLCIPQVNCQPGYTENDLLQDFRGHGRSGLRRLGSVQEYPERSAYQQAANHPHLH